MKFIAPEDIIGQSFLSIPIDNGTIDNSERHHYFIAKVIKDHNNNMNKDLARIKFLCYFNDNRIKNKNTKISC